MPYISTFDQNGKLLSKQEIEIPVGQYKAQKIEELRGIASYHIQSAGLDEKTQLNAIAGIYEPARCEAIKNYIAACRNEYLRCKALILAATTNDEADAVAYNPPQAPENL